MKGHQRVFLKYESHCLSRRLWSLTRAEAKREAGRLATWLHQVRRYMEHLDNPDRR